MATVAAINPVSQRILLFEEKNNIAITAINPRNPPLEFVAIEPPVRISAVPKPKSFRIKLFFLVVAKCKAIGIKVRSTRQLSFSSPMYPPGPFPKCAIDQRPSVNPMNTKKRTSLLILGP